MAHDGHPKNSLQLGSEVCRTDVSRGIGEEVPWMNDCVLKAAEELGWWS